MALSLQQTLPELADELSKLLAAAGHDDLAMQIADLSIVSRCHCGDDFCATFYTKPKPRGYGASRKSIDLEPQQGMIILDVVDGSIVEVEVLYRDEIRRKLFAAMP